MPARRRTSSRSRLNQAVRAGRQALRQAERRIPPDLRRQIDRSIKDGEKRFNVVLKDIRTRVSKATAPGELDRALKRFGDLSKQVEGLARQLTARAQSATRGTTARRATTRRTATRRTTASRTTARRTPTRQPATRKAATRKPATRKPATRKAAASAPATGAAAPRRTTRRRAAGAVPVITPMPPAVPEVPMEPMGPPQS